ncbi:response regulator transcription factor [Marinilabilia rubra]|nr:response regulator transcription factor [Marinilabilia rubra]
MDKIFKTVIVDDHKIFRTGLEYILNNLSCIKVIGEAGNAKDLFNLLKRSRPDLIFMDIKLPDTDGIETTKMVKEKFPDVNVIGLTMFSEIEYFNKMIEAGASGFLLKHTQEDELEEAIKTVMDGDYYFSKEFQANTLQNPILNKKKHSISYTKREIEILELIARGMSNHEIADQLNISVYTVDGHRRNLISKAGVKNSANLIFFAIQNGIIDP